MTVWITLSSGLMYRVNGRGRPRKPDGHLSPTRRALIAARDAAGERREARNAELAERTTVMVEMYGRGLTLEAIGKHFGVSRERVRQIVTEAGAKRAGHAARHKVVAEKKVAKRAAIDAACVAKYGVTRVEWKALSLAGVITSYRNQRSSAKARGIPWELTLYEWLTIWRDSGKLEQRGKGKNKYCMTRVGDIGPYKADNVVIKTNSENAKEGIGSRPRGVKQNPGVFMAYPGRSNPWIAIAQNSHIGYYKTQQDAVAARRAFMEEHGIAERGFGRGRGWTFRKGRKGGSKPYYMQCAYGARKITGSFATQEEAEAAYRDAVSLLLKDKT